MRRFNPNTTRDTIAPRDTTHFSYSGAAQQSYELRSDWLARRLTAFNFKMHDRDWYDLGCTIRLPDDSKDEDSSEDSCPTSSISGSSTPRTEWSKSPWSHCASQQDWMIAAASSSPPAQINSFSQVWSMAHEEKHDIMIATDKVRASDDRADLMLDVIPTKVVDIGKQSDALVSSAKKLPVDDSVSISIDQGSIMDVEYTSQQNLGSPKSNTVQEVQTNSPQQDDMDDVQITGLAKVIELIEHQQTDSAVTDAGREPSSSSPGIVQSRLTSISQFTAETPQVDVVMTNVSLTVVSALHTVESSAVSTSQSVVKTSTRPCDTDVSEAECKDRLLGLLQQGVQRLSSHRFSQTYHIDLQNPSNCDAIFAFLGEKKNWGKEKNGLQPSVQTAI